MEVKKMDIIQATRDLGKLIQQDERYSAYHQAKLNNDNDEVLQKLIGDFNISRLELNNEMSKEDKDAEKLKDLDEKIKKMYNEIMQNPSMKAFDKAKNDMDEMLSQINNIITMCANGENPETCSAASDCGGSCSSCSGCH